MLKSVVKVVAKKPIKRDPERAGADLIIANKELSLQNEEKGRRAIELNRINRLYGFISQVNKNIVRVKDEKLLFHNACSIAIEFGKFKMAWIGMFDKANHTITCVDQMCILDEDIEKFKDIPLIINGPQESVLNGANFFVCNDILANPLIGNWKPLALKYGISSFMIVPIKKSGKVIGTFNLYAADLNFFEKEEISLLVQVASDISFALDLFEKEKTYKHAQELVVQNEKRFRTMIEKSADMITLANREGRLVYGSPFITSVLGFSAEELINMSIYDVVHPDDIAELRENRNKLLKNPGKSFNFQQRRKHKNGNWVWCEGTFTNLLDEPGINAIVSNFRDISEKKMVEQQREFDRNNLDALINNTNDLLWSVDKNFNLITSNKPFDDILQLTSGKAVTKGANILEVTYSIEQSKPYKQLYERAFTGESFTEVIYNAPRVDSWSEVSYCPIRKGDEVIGAACHSRDITEFKKAAQQVIINEKRFRALVENGADAVAILSPTGHVNYMSPSFEGILGYTEEEAMKLDMPLLVHPENLAAVEKVWEQTLASYGVPVSGVPSRMLHKDGTWRWLEGTLTNLLHDPSVNGIVDNFRDITQKRLAEEGLLLNQFAIDNAADAVFWMTRDARIVKVNEAACTMLGYTRQEMVELSVPDIDPYYNAKKWVGHYAELRQKGSLFFETIQLAKDGRLIPVEIRANYIKFGDAEFNCAFSRDISERKVAERNLVKSETKLKEAQAVAHIGNFEIDLSDNSEIWSDEMFKIYGITKENATPSQELFSSFVYDDDKISVKTRFKKCLETFQDSMIDFRFVRNDGILRYGYTEVRFEFDKNQKPIRLFGIFQDITERKLAELERTQMVNDLMLRNIELEQFGYIISHNLRAPVANIIGASNALNDPLLDNEDREILSRGINQSVIKLDNVVKDLNQILQVKGEINDTKETVLFSELVDDIKTSIEHLIDKDDIEIKYDFGEINELLTLKPYLYSVFYNLISNSIKYRQQQIHTIIEIKSHRLKNKVELIFTDNGMGIDLEKSGGSVFGLYKRFHTNIEGKGMGLFMVKTQVETLGGKISVKSAVNQGTEFKIEFEV